MRTPRFFLTTFVFFVVLSSPSLAQVVKTVYNFSNPTAELPTYVRLTQGRDGWLYGTTSVGGRYGYGTIFKRQATGSTTVFLYDFHGTTDGSEPWGGLSLANDGNFYGTTTAGGTYAKGVLFRITPTGTLAVLYDFSGGADGSYPIAPPIQGLDGNFYGTTNGLSSQSSTVYKLTPAGAFSTLYTFNSSNGDDIQAPLVQTSDGTLYATAHTGGAFSCGSVIALTTAGVVKNTYSFNCTEGAAPDDPLIQAADGNLYGTTQLGGTHSNGTIFKLDGNLAFTPLYSFGTISGDGSDPFGGLTQGTDGNFYGTTASGGTGATIFELTSANVYSQLYNFPLVRGAGQNPLTAPTQHTNGKFYGVTRRGGTYALGSVYALDMGLGPFITFVRPSGALGGTGHDDGAHRDQ